MSATKLRLSEVISELRSELTKARDDGEKARESGDGTAPRFIVEEASIELQVGVTIEATGKGGVSFWVYSAEAGGKLERETVQKITVKLKPLDGTGGKWLTSGSAPRPQ